VSPTIFLAKRFEGKYPNFAWPRVEVRPEAPPTRLCPLEEPKEAMALEVPMEAWFSCLRSGRTDRLHPAGAATGSEVDRTYRGVYPRGRR
jgi:hypothetical protein